MNPECAVYGVIISIIVSLLKRIPFVRKFPKVVATVISSVLAIATAFWQGPADVIAIVQCVLEQLSVSVATYEVITKSVTKNLNLPER